MEWKNLFFIHQFITCPSFISLLEKINYTFQLRRLGSEDEMLEKFFHNIGKKIINLKNGIRFARVVDWNCFSDRTSRIYDTKESNLDRTWTRLYSFCFQEVALIRSGRTQQTGPYFRRKWLHYSSKSENCRIQFGNFRNKVRMSHEEGMGNRLNSIDSRIHF